MNPTEAQERAEVASRARALQSLFEHPGWKYVTSEWEKERQRQLVLARIATDSFTQLNAYLKADIAYQMLSAPVERLAGDVEYLKTPPEQP